jgi:hypothetical protein
MFSRICDAIESRSIVVSQDQEKELVSINGNWKLQIQNAIAASKIDKDEVNIF